MKFSSQHELFFGDGIHEKLENGRVSVGGACGLAPVILVGKKVYAKIEPYQIKGILDSCE